MHGSGVKNVNIIYRAGKDNVIADALSRNPQGPAHGEGLAETEIQFANVRSAPEERDSDISTLLQLEPEANPIQQSTLADEEELPEEGELPEDPHVSKKIVARFDQFVILGGVLYFVEVKKHTRKRAVVPARLKQELIQEAHGGPLTGWTLLVKSSVSHSVTYLVVAWDVS